MKYRKKILLSTIILLFMCYNLFPHISYNTSVIIALKKTYESVLTQIKESDKEQVFNIENNNIKNSDNKLIYKGKNIVGNGKIIKLSDDKTYGYIKYKNKCLLKEIDDKYVIYNNDCPKIDKPTKAADVVLKNSSEIKYDTYETGLNENLEFSSRAYYIGSNPSNYLIFSNQCWRIVNITQNDAVKLVYEGPTSINNTCEGSNTTVSGSIGLFTWDRELNMRGNWEEQSSLKTFMKYWQKEGLINTEQLKIKLDLEYLMNASWYIGNVSENNQTLAEDIMNERENILQDGSKLGLLNNSDYLKINCNLSSHNSNQSCSDNNYLYKKNYNWWTINTGNIENKKVWLIMRDGNIINREVKYSHEYYFSGVRLAVYLNPNTKIFGLGTEKIPYKIVK